MSSTEKPSAPAHPAKLPHKEANARTNLGRSRSLERRYFKGPLTAEEERRFEDLIYALRGLYKQAR
jgi:hypothetical protein